MGQVLFFRHESKGDWAIKGMMKVFVIMFLVSCGGEESAEVSSQSDEIVVGTTIEPPPPMRQEKAGKRVRPRWTGTASQEGQAVSAEDSKSCAKAKETENKLRDKALNLRSKELLSIETKLNEARIEVLECEDDYEGCAQAGRRVADIIERYDELEQRYDQIYERVATAEVKLFEATQATKTVCDVTGP